MEYNLRDAKQKYGCDGPMVDSEDGYFNHLDFDVTSLPEIGIWKVGEEYLLIVKVKEKKHELLKVEGSVKEKAEFEVLEVAAYRDEVEMIRDKVKEKLE